MFEFRPSSFEVRSRSPFIKAPSDQVARVIAQRAKQERVIKRAFLDYVEEATSPDVLEQVGTMYKRGDLLGMMRLPISYINNFAKVLRKVYVNTADVETAHLIKDWDIEVVKASRRITVDVSFNPGDPLAADYMRRAELEFIKELSRMQRSVIRESMTEALNSGIGYIEASRMFKQNLPLTKFQKNAVKNFRTLLETNNRQALRRALRDRRFDPSISRAIASGDPLSSTHINKMVNRYQSRMVDMRAETIARTEGLAATNAARHSATQQMMTKAGFTDDQIERIWRATNDLRVRDTHRAMHGQKRGPKEPFKSPKGAKLMYPGDSKAPAEEVINCRCVLEVRIKDDAAIGQQPQPQAIAPIAQRPDFDVPVAAPNPYVDVASDIFTPPANSFFIHTAEDVAIDIGRMAQRSKRKAKDVARDLQKKLDDMIQEGNVFIRVPDDRKILDDIAASGRLKSQHETNSSRGTLNPGFRAKEEYKMFGVEPNSDFAGRPIYGYVSSDINGLASSSVKQYGSIAIKLKTHKRPHTTVTGGDSLGGLFKPSPLNKPKVESFFPRAIDEATRIEEAAYDYVEAQIGKGVKLEDIDEIIFLGDPEDPLLTSRTRKLYVEYKPIFNKLGIKVIFHNPLS